MTQNAGNNNIDGFTPQRTRSMGPRPGKVTKGIGSNKPRIHLVSSKGKIPAGVYAEAIAHRQASKNEARTHIKLPNTEPSYKHAGVTTHPQNHQPLPSGVKPHHKETRKPGGVT